MISHTLSLIGPFYAVLMLPNARIMRVAIIVSALFWDQRRNASETSISIIVCALFGSSN